MTAEQHLPGENINPSTESKAQRLNQLLRLDKQFKTTQNVADRDVTVENTEGIFTFHLDNDMRFVIYRMLRGRLRSMPQEGLGNIGFKLIGGRIRTD